MRSSFASPSAAAAARTQQAVGNGSSASTGLPREVSEAVEAVYPFQRRREDQQDLSKRTVVNLLTTSPTTTQTQWFGAPQRLVAFHPELGLFVLGEKSESERQLYIVRCDKTSSDAASRVHKIILKTPIDASSSIPLAIGSDVQSILVNKNGNKFAIVEMDRIIIGSISVRARKQLQNTQEKEIECLAELVEGKAAYLPTVMAAEWHPLSDQHLAVLYSDNSWRLYNVNASDPSKAEQIYQLVPGVRSIDMVAFCFGCEAAGWSNLTVFFLAEDGDIYFLCPVIPYNCLLGSEVYDELKRNVEARKKDAIEGSDDAVQWSTAARWLDEVFSNPSNRSRPGSGRELVKVQAPSSVGSKGRNLVLQGPMNIIAGDEQVNITIGPSSLRCLPTEPVTLFRGWNSGFVDVLFNIEETLPRWSSPKKMAAYSETENSLHMFERLDLDLSDLSNDQSSSPLEVILVSSQPESIYIVHRSGMHRAKLKWLPFLRAHSQTSSLPSTSLHEVFSDPRPVADTPFRGVAIMVSGLIGEYFGLLTNSYRFVTGELPQDWGLENVIEPSSTALEDEITMTLETYIPFTSDLKTIKEWEPLAQIPSLSSSEISADYYHKLEQSIGEQVLSFENLYSIIEERVDLFKDVTSDDKKLDEIASNLEVIKEKANSIQSSLESLTNGSKTAKKRIENLLQRVNNINDTLSEAEIDHLRVLDAKLKKTERLRKDIDSIQKVANRLDAPQHPSPHRSSASRSTSQSTIQNEKVVGFLLQTMESHKNQIENNIRRLDEIRSEMASMRI